MGYFQLAFREADGGPDVEVAYFGLLPEWFGRGWGGWLLSVAVSTAWQQGAARVWLHTCTLDHPAALANYEARGFRRYDTHVETRRLREAGPRGRSRSDEHAAVRPSPGC